MGGESRKEDRRALRIVIAGTPRSGNTVTKFLCMFGFKDSWAGPGEADPRTHPTCKVDKATNMFYKLPQLCPEMPLFLKQGYGFIFMIRHPRGCFTSRTREQKRVGGGNLNKVRAIKWVQNARVYLNTKPHERLMIIRYEDLIHNPNEAQQRIADKFGLVVSTPFSDCHKRKGELANFQGLEGEGKGCLRPIDPSKSRLMPELNPAETRYIKSMSNHHPDMKPLMKQFGYDPNTLW